jgi:hypothetical protein
MHSVLDSLSRALLVRGSHMSSARGLMLRSGALIYHG